MENLTAGNLNSDSEIIAEFELMGEEENSTASASPGTTQVQQYNY